MADPSTMLDEMHQKITTSLRSMKKHTATFNAMVKAAGVWQQKLAETSAAEAAFYAALEDVGAQAHQAPGMADLGRGFNNLTDCSRGLIELQREVQRSLADEIVIPMTSRLAVDQRNVQRLEKEYIKQCTQQVELISKSEKEVEKWQKKARKAMGDPAAVAQVEAYQRQIRSQVQELDALRAITLTKVMTEERSRYAKIMLAVLDALKTESNYFQRSVPALDAVIRFCEPICFQPNKLPPGFQPLAKRGGPMKGQLVMAGGPAMQIPGPGRPVGYPSRMRMPPPGMPGRHPGMPAFDQSMGYRQNPNQSMMAGHGQPMAQPPTMANSGAQPQDGPLGPGQYRAKYPFHGQDTGQLSFGTGEVITVEGDPEDNWQFGTSSHTSKSGWFPVNYLERNGGDDASITSSAAPPPPADYHNTIPRGAGSVPPPPPPMPPLANSQGIGVFDGR